MYKDYLRVKQSPELTSRILVYEVGEIVKCMVYTERLGSKAFGAELQVALGDATTMLTLLTEQLGYDIGETRCVGFRRYIERQEEVSRKAGRDLEEKV